MADDGLIESMGLSKDSGTATASQLYRNFLVLSLSFSVLHGCVVAVLVRAGRSDPHPWPPTTHLSQRVVGRSSCMCFCSVPSRLHSVERRRRAVVAALQVQSTVVFGSWGAYSSGSLYVSYALSALIFAAAAVESLGSRRGLITACMMECVYVASFPIALSLKVAARTATPHSRAHVPGFSSPAPLPLRAA